MSDKEYEIVSVDNQRFKFLGTINITNVLTAVSKAFLTMTVVMLIDNIIIKGLFGVTILGGIWSELTPLIEPIFEYGKLEIALWILFVALVSFVTAYSIVDSSPSVRVLICNIKGRTIDDAFSIPITRTQAAKQYCGKRQIRYHGLGPSFMTHRLDGSRAVVAKGVDITSKTIDIYLTPLYGYSDLEVLAVEQSLESFQANYNEAKVETVFWRKNFSEQVVKVHIDDLSKTREKLDPYFSFNIPTLQEIETKLIKEEVLTIGEQGSDRGENISASSAGQSD